MDKLESHLTNLNLCGVDNQVTGHISPPQTVGPLEPEATPIAMEPPDDASKTPKATPQLPPEIVMHIMSFVQRGDQTVFANACKVSRGWYHAAIGFLYAAPSIENGRYEKFIAAVCPAVTGTRHSALAALIKSLDLSHLAYDGKSSDTARLLSRTAPNLVRFVAPAVQFGSNCFTALAKCCKLQVLDLRLVKPSIQLEDLLRHIKRLTELRTLNFPRSVTVPNYETEQTSLAGYVLPENLECFSLTGSISDTFLTTLIAPESLVEFRIFDAFARYTSIRFLLNKWSTQLKVLEVNYHISTLPHNAMDKILVTCPNLEKLRVAVDFITHRLFDEENAPLAHPLKRLDLDSSGYPGAEHKLKADHIFICLAEGRLSCLRIVRLSEKLNWVAKDKEGVDDLVQVLETRIDATNGVAGVWEFESTSREYGAF